MADVTSLSFADFVVQVGSSTFEGLDSPWPEHIVTRFMAALDGASGRVRDTLDKFNDDVLFHMVETHSNPWNGQLVNDTDRLQKRSGGLLEEIQKGSKVSGATLDDLTSTQSTGSLSIHETGGTIVAKNSKYLTIPLPAACDRRGVPIYKSAREWPNTFVQRSKAGNLIIFQKMENGSIRPLYLLKSSVYIKPRLGMGNYIDAQLPRLEQALITDLEEAFDAMTF